jgi:hypothetical protein
MSAWGIVLCLPSGTPSFDPVPEETAKRDVELSAEWNGTAAGAGGWGEGGWAALTLAAEHNDVLVQKWPRILSHVAPHTLR